MVRFGGKHRPKAHFLNIYTHPQLSKSAYKVKENEPYFTAQNKVKKAKTLTNLFYMT